MEAKEIVKEIKKSRKYSGISEEIIRKETEDFIKKNPKYEEYKETFILKQIKTRLHKMHGSFQTKKKNKINLLLEQLKSKRDNAIVRKILELNVSTKERVHNYGFIYDKIFELTGYIDTILDFGCGLNPISWPYMELDEDTRYYTYDINELDLDIIRKFFKVYNVDSHVEAMDLRSIDAIKNLPSVDLCLMFKVIDPLEKNMKGHKFAEELIQIMSEKCAFIVVSFASQTLSGKKMNYPQRGWIERMLSRIDLKYKTFETDNEIFYVIAGR